VSLFATVCLLAVVAPTAEIRIEVTPDKGTLAAATDGRLLLFLAPIKGEGSSKGDLFRRIHVSEAVTIAGTDANGLAVGKMATMDGKALCYPHERLSRVPAGKYRAQVVFDHTRDIRLPHAPGNLVSEPREIEWDPAKATTLRFTLSRAIGELREPASDSVRYLRLKSAKLSKFWGRDITLRAGVRLPWGWKPDGKETYPLRVHIGGFGTRYTAVHFLPAPGEKDPRFLTLVLDGAGPLGDPYQVNSANHGPWGDALVEELIPYVEKTFRGNGKRVTDGGSTGGWVSFALQVFYPETFHGCWSHCPDPVDFRDFQLMDLYRDTNAYVNRRGFERASRRNLLGDTDYTVRPEVLIERVLGREDRWELSGRDWGSWNATFGPRGKDGLPVPLWDGPTGKIDRDVLDHWRRYDLRLHLETNWKTLAPKLRGKIHIFVGDADEYFLNNAVERLNAFLEKAKPAYEGRIEFARRKGHNWRALTERQMLQEMEKAVTR
jgi:hypothetical protein